jgi:hypothetical protein
MDIKPNIFYGPLEKVCGLVQWIIISINIYLPNKGNKLDWKIQSKK